MDWAQALLALPSHRLWANFVGNSSLSFGIQLVNERAIIDRNLGTLDRQIVEKCLGRTITAL